MELHFCSQCGISIPLAEVQAGVAAAGDGRTLCAEHRPAKAAAPVARTEDVELLFCANCQVSIPASDVESSRARREFGSLFCAACSVADTAERDRRRRSVEADLAESSPAGGTSGSPSHSSSARESDTAGALAPAVRGAPPIAGEPASASSATWVLAAMLVVASLAAGYFGTEYVRARSAPAGPAPASARDLADLRADLTRSVEEARAAASAQGDFLRKSDREAIERAQAKLTEDLVGLREDLSEVRSRLMGADGELAQRIARVEGQVGGLQEMLKGLAARPSGDSTRPPVTPEPGPTVRPPEGPPAEPPAPPPGEAIAPEVIRLIKDLLESKDEGARFAAANELTRRKERAAITAFAKQVVDDPNFIVRRSCARGLGDTRAWFGVPYLIQALDDEQAFVAQQACFALQAITGQDFGVTIDTSNRDRKIRAANATKWWEKNKGSPPDGVCTDPVNLEKR